MRVSCYNKNDIHKGHFFKNLEILLTSNNYIVEYLSKICTESFYYKYLKIVI